MCMYGYVYGCVYIHVCVRKRDVGGWVGEGGGKRGREYVCGGVSGEGCVSGWVGGCAGGM
jgi:hypothetical protein